MNGILIQIAFLILAYILGSIPWALVISKLTKGIDIREYGSKNMGATNAFRVLGFKWGLLVFFLDALKGGVIVFLMDKNIFNFDYENFSFIIHPLIYGIAAFLGHLFPIFTKFKGGKGMSTAAGIVLFYSPLTFLIGLVAFLLTVGISKYVSLGSCLTCLSCLIASLIFSDSSSYLSNHLLRADIYFIVILIFINIFIFVKHIPNFKRIVNKTESKVNFKALRNSAEPAFIITEENKKED